MITIKTIDAVNAYNELKTLKLSTIDDELMINIWKNIKQLRSISEEYEKDINDSRNALNDDKLTEMQGRLHNARMREERVKKGEYTLTIEDYQDVDEINRYFDAYANKVEKFNEEIANKEIEINIVVISDADFLKVLKANDKDFIFMEKVSWMLY